jgi:ubiquinone/menaquinone biosynthesis C-methylase UbiE
VSAAQDIPHPRFARWYIKCAGQAEARGAAEHRQRMLEGLSGRVVEVGAGHGLNFAYYPQSVTEVVAIEPEPTLRAAAERAASAAPVPVTVRPGTAESLPFAEGEMDGAVASLMLCSVPNQGRALAEMRRVLRPGGELRFYEHVIATRQPLRGFLRFLDRSGIWPKLAAGCHPDRDTRAAIESAGFAIERCERFGFAAGPLQPQIPHILGVATKR